MSRARDVSTHLPLGGATGQVLKKSSANDFDVEWAPDATTETPPIEPGSTQPDEDASTGG